MNAYFTPKPLYKVDNTEVRQFVEKCLATVSLKLSARELLDDLFLQIYDYGFDSKVVQYQRDCYEVNPLIRKPLNGIYSINNNLMSGDIDNVGGYGPVSELDYHRDDFEASPIDLFGCEVDENLAKVDTTIKGRREDDGIFLTLRIADNEGYHFTFVEAMNSKIILMMPKNQELSKFQRIRSRKGSRIKFQRIKIQKQSSFKNQDSRIIKIKIQDSRFKNQEKTQSR